MAVPRRGGGFYHPPEASPLVSSEGQAEIGILHEVGLSIAGSSNDIEDLRIVTHQGMEYVVAYNGSFQAQDGDQRATIGAVAGSGTTTEPRRYRSGGKSSSACIHPPRV
ncbi:MAG: hypothetical protein R6T83_06590 [Salinibacter sp.]